MKDGQLFRVKVIKTEADLPKENGTYFTLRQGIKYTHDFIGGKPEKKYYDNLTFEDFWLKHITSYLEPIEEQEPVSPYEGRTVLRPDVYGPGNDNYGRDKWKEELAECIKKAEPNLSKIKDVDQELAEIRGVETLTDADIEAWARGASNIPEIQFGMCIGAKAVLNGEIKHIEK
jgi:hypothetical protein